MPRRCLLRTLPADKRQHQVLQCAGIHLCVRAQLLLTGCPVIAMLLASHRVNATSPNAGKGTGNASIDH
jgi:hypothetical protein